MQVIPIYNRGSREESKNYVVLCDMPRQNSWLMWQHIPAFQREGGVLYLTPVITSERLSHLTALFSALDNYMTTHFVHRWFHLELSCETGQCAKKVLAESHFFLKHGWIHFLVFLLIPRYNHNRIIREFRRPRRRTGILCFVMEGYALIAVRRWIVWAYVCLRTIMW